MAKRVILESYSFTASSKTITITGKAIRKEQLILITNVTTNVVVYNFADANYGGTVTNTISAVDGTEQTVVVFSTSNTGMSNTDKLSILVEEVNESFMPAEVMRDPVDKLRVSTPQSMIDTDFEYGMQPTKWESLTLTNNRPSAFYDFTQGISNTSRSDLAFPGANTSAYQITAVTSSAKVVTVAIGNTTGITVGTPIFIQGTLDEPNVQGWWLVETVSANTNFTFTVFNTPTQQNSTLFDATKTTIFIGMFYSSAAIPVSASAGAAISLSGTVATVTTTNDHGLRVGNTIYVVGTTGATGTLNSTWVVATTPTNTTFTFACTATGTITATAGATATLYTRPLGYVIHRPYDGGVQFGNITPYHGTQILRQTRRQFRYQSGKGIQFSTGTILKPNVNADTLTSSGTTVTVTTKYPHGLLPGAYVKVSGCNETAYNGTFAIVTAPTPTTFTYTALATPSAATATGIPLVNPYSWWGNTNRIGMFDHQNGFYYEFDGQNIYAVRRCSTYQLSGFANVTNASQSVTGSNTKFSTQLLPGDWIVIRGMSYLVQQITSDTQMYIYPEYKGPSNTASTYPTIISKTINTRYIQSSWNIDKMDGTGASLMNIDLSKMQMFYMDFTWYGAGAIRFGLKNNRGEVIYSHRIPNNNVNTEAYMRSGNLVARYEVNHLPAYTTLSSTLTSGVTASMTVTDASMLPASGTVILTQSAATGAVIEYVTYASKSGNTLNTLTRNATGGNAAATTFTYSATAPIKVELYSPQAAGVLSHWGSSVIMDGRYDDDKSLVFNAGSLTALSNLAQNVRQPIMSIRIAPAIDSGLTGLLGYREVINRMQLTLRQMDVYTSGTAFKIEVFLNGKLSGGTFAPLGGSSLAQVAYHTGGQTITGGESIFGFFTSNTGSVTQDLSIVRDIGNSILGGGNSLNVPSSPTNLYPDGPDVLTVCCTNITATATNTINSRISWTEAQA